LFQDGRKDADVLAASTSDHNYLCLNKT
jgi:hypothetical protein